MNAYSALSRRYDVLTEDIPYAEFASYYEDVFSCDGGDFHLLLDLCCGTGTLTWLLAEKGFEMIGTDASDEMLSVAVQKSSPAAVHPLFLCQAAEDLDLYGTVDAAVSSLDSINYISPQLFPSVLKRLHLFIRPGGLFIFDIRSEKWLKQLDGGTFVDEKDDLLCLWRADFDAEHDLLRYGIDIFSRKGTLWERQEEEHIEYVYREADIEQMLCNAGFTLLKTDRKGPQGNIGREFYICRRNF